ncbi:MAG: flagellar hook-associated protein FlgK, partial [Alphaproteobacteria bacterium]|nr:flagellar hook-associated protein FlgK [Alphaproteobacteria bacterium]
MTLTLALNSAISGLSTAQAGLDVISHNIANVNTEGFTRKVFEPESRVLAGNGVGVQLGDVRNAVDQNLLKDVREERSTFGVLDAKRAFLKRVQDLFGTTTSNNTISHRINNLQQDFETLASEPDKATTHLSAVQAGITVADQLSRMSKSVQGYRLDADREIERGVQELNGLLKSISNINDQISLNAATNRQTEDLEDKRDVALNRLSDLIDIQYFRNSNGAITVFTSDGTTLVDSSAVNVSHVALSLVNASHTYAGGDFNGIFVGMRDVTNSIRSGKLKSLVEMRDRILPDMQGQLDELSRGLLQEMNKVSNRGTSFPSMVNNVTGTRSFLNSATQTLTFSGGQTNVVIYDGNGNERFSSRLLDTSGINFANGGTVDSLATQLQTWLQGLDTQLGNASVSVTNGKLNIRLGTETFGIAF